MVVLGAFFSRIDGGVEATRDGVKAVVQAEGSSQLPKKSCDEVGVAGATVEKADFFLAVLDDELQLRTPAGVASALKPTADSRYLGAAGRLVARGVLATAVSG